MDNRNKPRNTSDSPIARARRARNITQAEMANKLGVTQICVSRWETGKRDLKLTTLRHIADVLGCEMNELLDE